MTTAPAATPGFVSLAKLQENHAALVKEVGKEVLAHLEPIELFVRKAIATGTVLDAPTDRAAVQSLIAFWIARLTSSSRDPGKDSSRAQVPEFEDTLLAEFNSDDLATEVIAPTDEWLNRQSPTDQALARRLVLRLVSLREDGSFEVVPSASGVCDDLAPQDRAEKVLAELVRLGVVRSIRNPSGYEEFALRSVELLTRWRRLQEWMAQRKRFRHKAMEWARRRAEKAADPSNQAFMRRAGKAFGEAVLSMGAWIEKRWRALSRVLMVFFKIRRATDTFFGEDEYEEAETYRDKNAVELKLVYQRRQLDKERQEIKQVRAFASAAAAIVFAALSAVAIWGWREAEKAKDEVTKAKDEVTKAKDEEERNRKRRDLQIASWHVERGAQLEADDRDTSGAFLWYNRAWSTFDTSADVLEPGKGERLRASYLLRLGIAREQLPILSGMAYHEHSGELGGASAFSSDGSLLLTVAAAQDERPIPPDVMLWTKGPQDASWVGSPLEWGPFPLGTFKAFAEARAYLSPDPDRRFAVVSGGPKDTGWAIYVWGIPANGKGVFIRELDFKEKLIDAGFSPDGQFFAVVSQSDRNTDRTDKVRLWRTNCWDAPPIELAGGEGISALGRLAFCPTPSSNRLAVAVGPGQVTSGSKSVICLEWLLGEKPGVVLTSYVSSPERLPLASHPDEFLTFVTYKPDGSGLLVSRSWPKRAQVWLFDSKEVPTEIKEVSTLQPLWPPPGPVLHAAFSPLGDRLVIARGDGWAELRSQFTFPDKKLDYWRLDALLKHKAQVFKANFSPDGQYIVTASRDYRAKVWYADSGKLAQPSIHHSGSVTDAGFIDDGRYLITSSRDMIYRWDLTRGESRSLPLGTMRGIRTTSADLDGNLLVTAGDRQNRSEHLGSAGWARVWDVETGDPRSPELQHPAPVRHAAICASGRALVSTVTSDGEVRLWEASSGRELWWSNKPEKEETGVYTALVCGESEIHLLALTHSGTSSLSSDSFLRIYHLNSEGEQTDQPQKFKCTARFNAASFGPGCKHVIAYTGVGAGDPGEAVVWELKSEKPTPLKGKGKQGKAHDEVITHVAFTLQGDRLVTTSRDDKAYVWDLSKGIPDLGKDPWELGTNEDPGHTGDIVFASFDRAGTRVVTAGADGKAIVWQWAPEQNKYSILWKLNNGQALTHAMFCANESYLVTADEFGTIRLWDVNDGQPLATRYFPGRIVRLGCHKDDVHLLGSHSKVGSAEYMPSDPRTDFSGTYPSAVLLWPAVSSWHLTPAAQPRVEDQNLAKWTASRHALSQNDRMELESLLQNEIFDMWKNPNTRPDLANTMPRGEKATWHEREAALCELAGHWGAALEHWKSALKDGPATNRQPMLHAGRARAYSEQKEKNWENAERDLSEALKQLLPDSPPWRAGEIFRARAEARLQQGHANKLEEAISDCLQALKMNRYDGLAHALLAQAYFKTEKFPKEAVQAYDEAVKRIGQNPDLLLKRAKAREKLENRRFDLEYDDFLTAGRLFKEKGDFERAAGAYHAAVMLFCKGVESSRHVRAKVHAELAELQEIRAAMASDATQRQNLYKSAHDHFFEATEKDKTVWTHWKGLGRSRQRLGDFPGARDAFKEASRLNGDDLDLAKSTAEVQYQLKDWDTAVEAYRKLIKLQPNVSHRLRLADSLIQLRHWDDAAKEYNELIRLNSRNWLYRRRLAEIYLQPTPPDKVVGPERLEEARRCLDETAKDKYFSQQSEVWLRLAVVQLALGKFDEYKVTRDGMLEAFKYSTGVNANNVAWAAAFAKDTPEGTDRAVKLAEKAVSMPQWNLRTAHGAVLYRAGNREKAIVQLKKATKERTGSNLSEDQKAYGNAMDLLFMAMAQYTPEKPEQAQQTLELAIKTINNFESAQKSETPDQSLRRVWERLEFEVLRREAQNLINP
jgi:WD40 repeat protein/tetratricopeptide (TPR) repeat protein